MLANADYALRAARKKFAAQNFEEAIRILEELPKESRPDSVIEVLLESHSNVRKLADLWDWIDESWKQAQDSARGDDYQKILPLLDEILAIRSKDTVALDRIK